MGMFDWYVPTPPRSCPTCAEVITRYQGKDGPNILVVWVQGYASPVCERTDERLPDTQLANWRLPELFRFDGWCSRDHVLPLQGRCADGTWVETTDLDRR